MFIFFVFFFKNYSLNMFVSCFLPFSNMFGTSFWRPWNFSLFGNLFFSICLFHFFGCRGDPLGFLLSEQNSCEFSDSQRFSV